MKKFNKFISVAVASAMVMSMAGCGNTDNGSAATGTNAATESAASGSVFKIGGIGPTTGGAAVFGLAVQHGAEIAVEETNAAGGIGFGPGTLMAITDHINMTGQNPLIGENLDDFGPRFPDMSKAYTPEYRETAHKVADKLGIKLDDGVYIGVTGPTYETPAEIRAYKTLGADAVGMSTVPEVIVAAHSGLKVLGISCITNFAAGFQEELNHEEVVEVTERVKGDFKGLLKAILAEL